eukprot:Nitzschia sp. Nitz4//scaffold20_size174350//65316//67118//NITZ4_002095-RA/size174350-processed-gene-0.97-mRNA-1//-1//CDS//3329541788//2667//frame0
MEELYTFLSSSARINKSKRKKRQRQESWLATTTVATNDNNNNNTSDDEDEPAPPDVDQEELEEKPQPSSRDRTGKRDTSVAKQEQVHQEQVFAFRNSMSIRVANKHDPDLPDPISSFSELDPPTWWQSSSDSFAALHTAITRNIEAGRWKEPTPIQMQSLPALLERRDLIAAAPTGSGKSGAFILPALFLSSAPFHVYYGKKESSPKKSAQGEIRTLLLAPSRELAAQLHREVERLGFGKPGGISSMLLSKSNASHLLAGTPGGKNGLDVLVTTPLRLVDVIQKGLRLGSMRLVVLDEADRLLDAADGKVRRPKKDSKEESDEEDEEDEQALQTSGSSQSQTFLAQMDIILSTIPSSAVRALFSATVTPTVRLLSESVLRNPIDLKIAAPGSYGGANTDIEQELLFVGREEGKLLAIRQLKERGELKPPCIVFVQSQDRAQALFAELLYEGLHVDVIHAGRSRTARDQAVAKFRKGETWLLICTDLVARGVDFRAVNMVINYDLPTSGITYVHRIGRTGRAGRKGKAITLFTEADFEHLRTVANVMKQSGCKVEDWMLQLKKDKKGAPPIKRPKIDTTSGYDKKKRNNRRQMIRNSKGKR